MALSYGPARALAYDWRRGFRAWVDCDDRHGNNFCLVRCNAHKRNASIANDTSVRYQNCRRAASRACKVPKKTKSCFLRDRKPPQSGYSTESGHICGPLGGNMDTINTSTQSGVLRMWLYVSTRVPTEVTTFLYGRWVNGFLNLKLELKMISDDIFFVYNCKKKFSSLLNSF
jgi:hypothetical protein